MKNSFNINDYQLIQDKKENYLLFKVVLFLMLIVIFIVLYKFEFQIYEKKTLIKDNDNYILIVDSNEIAYYENEKYVYIHQNKIPYNIVKIDNDYSNVNDIIYQSIYIKPYNYETDAIITECYFLKSKQSIFETIIKFIKGGLG